MQCRCAGCLQGVTAPRASTRFSRTLSGEDARRVYLLKGGPGTGKSSLMKDLAAALQEEGFALELFFCSSDSHSLDAFSCPELGVAVVDATFPHVQEPQWPGSRDELIYLGAFWDGERLAERREEIAAAGQVKGKHFAAAYRYFRRGLGCGGEHRGPQQRKTGLRCFLGRNPCEDQPGQSVPRRAAPCSPPLCRRPDARGVCERN